MANEIQSFLDPSNVIVSVEASCKRGILRALAVHAAKTWDLNETKLLDALLEREQLGTTGIGRGVAVPHARTNVSKMRGVFVQLSSPIDFDAIDQQPVDLVFLLLAPEAASADHLKALSRVARLFRSPDVLDAMRGATDAESLFAILTGSEDAQAA